jgi:hypothetical protein
MQDEERSEGPEQEAGTPPEGSGLGGMQAAVDAGTTPSSAGEEAGGGDEGAGDDRSPAGGGG